MKKRPIAFFLAIAMAAIILCGCRGNNQTPQQRLSGALENAGSDILAAFIPEETAKLVKESDKLGIELKFTDDEAFKLLGSDLSVNAVYGREADILTADLQLLRSNAFFANLKAAFKDGVLVIDWNTLEKKRRYRSEKGRYFKASAR